jgi:anti-sigma factor RsiW
MDEDARRRRREQARQRAHRQRRLVAAGAAAVVVLLLVAGGLLVGADGGGDQPEASPEPRRAELPRGGRTILPNRRVVAFYGAPQDRELGVLGIGPPRRAARRLERQARPYVRRGRPVLPAFELIAAIVTSDPGDGGDHSTRQEPKVVRRYLRAARAHKMLLLLDIQPGYAPFLQEAKALERFLKEPDVSLALDPEWSMDPPQLPGQEIGSTEAATINDVSRYLSRIVRKYDLPQKLLVVHRFTGDMIQAEHELERHPGVALVVNVDGFGDRPNKISKYNEFTHDLRRRFNGFKLFYEEDLNLMKPKQVLRLRPQPDLVVYE